MPADEFNDNDGGDICTECQAKKSEEDIFVDLPEIDYIFHFFNKAGEYLDCTSLDENNPTLALSLFKDEFGWGEMDGYVELIEFEDPTLYNDSSKFELSSDVREDGRAICSASTNDKDDVARLKSCPLYNDEEDAFEGRNTTCAYCWAKGFRSVCERKPKEVV